MREGFAFVISAPSGTGKSTLINKLRAVCPEIGFSVSCTTRKMRPGEVEGKDYFFISMSEFENMRKAGEFAEWAEVHGNLYGTPLAPVLTMLKEGINVIFDIDVVGAAQLRASVARCTTLFILPPSIQELQRRLRARGFNDESSLKRRLADAEGELKQSYWYDHQIINNNIEEAFSQLHACYLAASLTPLSSRQIVDSLLAEIARCPN